MIWFPSQNEPVSASRRALLLLPLLLWLAGCNGQGLQALPSQMIGEWRTDEPRYHGRFMRLETDRVTFGLGTGAPDQAEHVERVKLAPRDNPMDYTIRLTAGDGTPDSIVLQFTPQNGGELRLKNQPKIVWRRKSEPARALPKGTPQQETPSPDQPYREHKTIYKIDCVRPKVCRSY
jgi:hypothetical protein